MQRIISREKIVKSQVKNVSTIIKDTSKKIVIYTQKSKGTN